MAAWDASSGLVGLVFNHQDAVVLDHGQPGDLNRGCWRIQASTSWPFFLDILMSSRTRPGMAEFGILPLSGSAEIINGFGAVRLDLHKMGNTRIFARKLEGMRLIGDI
jgi:hypothetical protein